MNCTPSLAGAPHPAFRRAAGVLLAGLTSILTSQTPLLAQPASANPPTPGASGEAPVRLEAFVSTGTRFNDRTVVDSPVPIDVVTQTELQQGGYTETSQMLQALVPSFNFPRPSLTDGTDHIRPATLRGLAPDQVLVLVNGKRRHTSALVNVNGSVGRGSVSVDFNAIPSSAIDRVEVLRDGASAQYGSDAIAGVINVILRKDHGWQFDATYGETKEDDGEDLKLSGSAGVALGKKGSLFATAYWRKHGATNRSEADTRQQYFGRNAAGALTAISGNIGSGTGLTPSNGTLDPRELGFNRIDHRYGDPKLNERGLLLNAEAPVGNFAGYLFGSASRRHGEGAGFFRRPGDDRTVRALWPDGFLPVIQSNIHDLSLGGGLRGKVAGDWDMDLSSVIGSNEIAYTTAQSNNVTLGAASPRSFYAGTLTFKQHTTNLDFRNALPLGLKQPTKIAAGAEYRHEHYNIRPGAPDSYQDGGVRILDGPNAGAQAAPGAQVFPGFRPGDAGSHTRDAYAVYVDAEQALTEAFLVSAAARFEDYNDFGSEATGKLAGRLKLSPTTAVRGSVSTGFRAPHLAQQWFSSTATNFIGGVPFENKTFPVSDPVARALGAQPLDPETSFNVGLGLTWQPVPAFTSSIDFYEIEIDDRVVLSSNFTGAPGSAFLNYLNAQGLFGTTGGRYFTNAVDTRTRGVDVNARYVWQIALDSRVTLTAGFNLNETKIQGFKPTPPQLAAVGITTPLFDLTERIRMEKGQPKDIFNVSAAYEIGRLLLFGRLMRYGEVQSVQLTNVTPAQFAVLSGTRDVYLRPTEPPGANSQVVQRFAPKWVTDLEVAFRWSPQLSISLGANNAFDVRPDKSLPTVISGSTVVSGNDNQGSLPYLLNPSPIGFNGVFYYAKVGWKF